MKRRIKLSGYFNGTLVHFSALQTKSDIDSILRAVLGGEYLKSEGLSKENIIKLLLANLNSNYSPEKTKNIKNSIIIDLIKTYEMFTKTGQGFDTRFGALLKQQIVEEREAEMSLPVLYDKFDDIDFLKKCLENYSEKLPLSVPGLMDALAEALEQPIVYWRCSEDSIENFYNFKPSFAAKEPIHVLLSGVHFMRLTTRQVAGEIELDMNDIEENANSIQQFYIDNIGNMPFLTRKRPADKSSDIDNKKQRVEESSKDFSGERDDLGLTQEHVLKIRNFCRTNGFLIMWRPINEASAEKIKTGYTGKGMSTKGKSSEFGPISGDVPFYAVLSKLLINNQHDIERYQEKNNSEIENANLSYSSIIKENILPHVKLAKLNEKSLATKIAKKVYHENKEYNLYFFPKGENDVHRWKDKEPLFAIQDDDEGMLIYNYDRKVFEKERTSPLSEKKLVEIISYRNFELQNEELVELESSPITADYDELVSTGPRIFPMENHDSVPVNFTWQHFKKILHKTGGPVANSAQLILEAELRAEREKEANPFHPTMGSVNDQEWAMKVFLKGITGGATNHGPEVNNPYPEIFSDAKYPVFMPNGGVGLLHNEKEVCDFINKWRRKGYPLKVNNKWGWELVNKDNKRVGEFVGDLRVPDKKFDWQELDNLIRELEALKEQQGIILQSLNITDEKYAEEDEEMRKLQYMWQAQKEAMDLKLEIEAVKTKPPLIYSEFKKDLKSLADRNRELHGNKELAHLLKIKTRITELYEKDRNKILEKLIDQLEKRKLEYKEKIIGNELYIEKIERDTEIEIAGGSLMDVLPLERSEILR